MEIELSTNGSGLADQAGLLRIIVYTGNKAMAGTDAKVSIMLDKELENGDQLNSGEIKLKGKFEAGDCDICIQPFTENFSPVDTLTIWHDNSGFGPGWFLDKVVIESYETSIQQTFPCLKWLATDEGDGQIKRVLKENMALRRTVKSAQPWNLEILTSDLRSAGTDANVKMVVYGWTRDENVEKEIVKSEVLNLDNKSDNFERGKTDQFKIELPGNLVEIYKVRVWHDGTGRFSGWHLDSVKLSPVHSSGQLLYNFDCKQWLARSEGDGELVREMGAREARNPEATEKVYKVAVYTGKVRGAGTDANVFCNIFGTYGDSGDRFLRKSANRNKFENGQLDEFEVKAIDLGEIYKLRIGHDSAGPGAGWFLDKVVINNSVEFQCNRWLDKKEDDGRIVRELFTADQAQMLHTTSYHIAVKTGDVVRAGTDANVFIQIFGDENQTEKLALRSPVSKHKNKFERAQVDKFIHELEDIGTVERIIIGHDGKRLGSGWYCDWVELFLPEKGMKYTFNVKRWIDSAEGDKKLEVECYPSNTQQVDSQIPYEITVETGDKSGAGTDANVFIQLYGDQGKTEQVVLNDKSDNFERGAIEKFKRLMSDVGEFPLKLRVGHDGKGFGDGWFLNRIIIQRPKNKKRRDSRSSSRRGTSLERMEVDTWYFNCNRWLAKSEDDGAIIGTGFVYVFMKRVGDKNIMHYL